MSKRRTPSRGKAKAQTGRDRTCLLVLGMHRSGTSALTRMISLLGADLPATLLRGSPANLASNAKGHWESEAVARLNDEIFRSAGITWRSPEAMTPGWYQSVRFEEFRERAKTVLENEFRGSPLFVLKDPRICKLVPFWLSVMEEAEIKPAIITMIRSPEEVAGSLLKRNGLDPPLGVLMWLRYVLSSERDSRDRKRVHESYDRVLADWQSSARSISETFDLHWPSASRERTKQISAFLSESERHHVTALDISLRDDVRSWATEAYAILNEWVQCEERASDHERLDAIGHKLDQVVQPLLEPLLVAYEKSTAVQKLQALRTQQQDRIDEMNLQLRSIGEQVAGLATDAQVPLVSNDEGRGLEVSFDTVAADLGNVAAELKQERESSARELVELKEELNSKNEELALQASEHSDIAARLNSEMAELAALHEREKQAAASRESRLHDILETEREQRLGLETKLAQTEKINAALLIVRGKFEAISEELVRLRAEYEDAQSRSKDLERQLEDVQAQTQKLQVELEDVQRRSKNDREKLRNERDNLQSALAAVRDDRALRLGERDSQIKELKRSVKRLEQQVERGAQTRFASLPARAAGAVKLLFRGLIPGLEQRRLRETIELIRNSGLFDARYYGERYPDVSGDPRELLEHFVRYGGVEGRAPSAAFDSRKYLQRYPDVAAAGLNPLVHFLQCGKDEGRVCIPVGNPEAPVTPNVRRETATVDLPDNTEELRVEENRGEIQLAAVSADEPSPGAARAEERGETLSAVAIESLDAACAPQSESFSALAIGASDWLRSAELPQSESVTVDGIRVAVESPSAGLHSSAPLKWFDALTCGGMIDSVDGAAMAVRKTLCGDRLTIEDVWLSNDFEVGVRLSGHWPGGFVIRCCQQADSGSICLCAEQWLAGKQSHVVAIGLVSRFAPILLVFTDEQGALIDCTLLPFPTLLRGGLHHAELIDFSRSPSGWDAHEAYASELLIAFADESADFAICNVSVNLRDANGSEPVFSAPFREWVCRQFDVQFTPKLEPESDCPGLAALAKRMRLAVEATNDRRTSGRTLLIDANSIPSLGVLLAREADLDDASALRTIIVDELTRRPLRAVDHPIVEYGSEALLQQAFAPSLMPGKSQGARARVVSISFSAGGVHDVRAAFPVAGDVGSAIPELIGAESAPVSAVISCSGSVEGLRELLASLARQRSLSALECLLIGNVPDAADSQLLPFHADTPMKLVRTRIEGGTTFCRVHAAVEQATHDRILLVDDKKVLHDPRTLSVLGALCEREKTGTAGCQLVSETTKTNSVPEYMTRTGFVPVSKDRGTPTAIRPSSDRLALPPVYPLVANPISCLMTKREVWPAVSNLLNDSEVEGEEAAVVLGLAVTESGMLNIATSLVSISDLDATSSADIPAPWLPSAPKRFVALEEY